MLIKVKQEAKNENVERTGMIDADFTIDQEANIDEAFEIFGQALILTGYHPDLVLKKIEGAILTNEN